MLDSTTFAVAVARVIGEQLAAKRHELALLMQSHAPFKEWVAREAYLACQLGTTSVPFSEVTAMPTYASEGIPSEGTGDLRVGGPDDGANHCWAFVEFVVSPDAGRATSAISVHVERLRRLGWKKSAALLVVLYGASQPTNGRTLLNQPTLCKPLTFALPNGTWAILEVFDVKVDPTHILSVSDS